VVFKNYNRFEAPGLHLTAQGFEIESSFAHRLMQILMAVVVVKMQFEKPVRESIQPFLESHLGKDQKMTGIEAKSQFFTEFFPQFDEVIGPCVENIFEADPGIYPACRFEEFTPHLQAVLQPQIFVEGKSKLVETRMEHDLPRLHLVGQFHDLGETEPGDFKDPGIESSGGEIDKRGVKCESLTFFPPSDHLGNVTFGDGIEQLTRQIDLREKAAAVQKLEVLVKILQSGPAM
jgi:hypothetical protein